MKDLITPYKLSPEGKRNQIEKMFDNISTNYDVLNTVITGGMDKRWRNNVLDLIVRKKPDTILDIATGTADMAILLSKTNARYILAIDISRAMLDVADKKIKRLNLQAQIHTQIQDAENINVQDNFFDVATVTYGTRNFQNLELGLSEILRVIKPGGSIVILETSIPAYPLLRRGYLFYTKRIMPRIASLISRDKSAYAYLAESAIHFPYGDEFIQILIKTGFKNVKSIPQMFGISTIYQAEK